jgi:hypothetical protein
LEDQRVDDDRACVVIVTELEVDSVVLRQNHAAGNFSATGGKVLVDVRARLADIAGIGVEDDCSVTVGINGLTAVEADADARRIGLGSDDEIVLEAAVRAGFEDEVDSRVELLVADASGLWDAGLPTCGVVSDEIAARARQWVERFDWFAAGAGYP